MDDNVVNVDDDVLDLVEDLFHQALERGWAAQMSHGGGDPFKLSDALNRESRGVTVGFVNWHLPETGGEVNGREDRGVGPSDVTDALVDFFH